MKKEVVAVIILIALLAGLSYARGFVDGQTSERLHNYEEMLND